MSSSSWAAASPVRTGPLTPKVSVVMAVLRPHPVYFPEAVRSILAQTMSDLELVIVEDPSPVSGAAMLAGIDDLRMRYIAHPTRTSLVAQRNRCLAEARSEYVAVMDADDVAEPDRLARQVEFLDRNPGVDVVGCQLLIVDPDSRPLGYRTYPQDAAAIRQALRRLSALPHNGVVYRKRTVLDVGGYQFSYNNTVDDYDLWSRLARRERRMVNLPDALVHYRIHPGQMKATHLRDTIRGVLAVKRRYWLAEMTASERAQVWAETVLPYLPAGFVLRLLIKWRWLSRTAAEGAAKPAMVSPAGRQHSAPASLDRARVCA